MTAPALTQRYASRAVARSSDRSRADFPVGLVLLAGVSAVFLLRSESPTLPMLLVAAVAACSAMAGEARVTVFCFGLSVTAGVQLASGVPLGALVIAGIVFGAALRALAVRTGRRQAGALLSLSIAVALYWAIDAPVTNAGYAGAYALILLPLSFWALRFAMAQANLKRGVAPALAAGLSLSVGSGLIQAYRSVGASYSSYQDARLFESSIGSSNFAAGLAVTVGILLLSVGLSTRGPGRWALLVFASPFVAAPLVLASRGAVLALLAGAFALAFAVVAPRRGRKARRRVASRIIWTSLALAALASLAAQQDWFVWQRLTDRLQGGAGFDSGRGALWSYTLQLVGSYPFTGLGPGGLTDALLARMGYAYSHNFLLDVLAQLGILGAVVALWIIRPQPMTRPSLVLPALAALTVHSLVEPNISTPRGAAMYAGLAACHYWSAMLMHGDETREDPKDA